ncbi:ABC transporter ATP-binding protein [Neokomagataea thailandica]|uniref:Peptide ABC transporter ATP-binding protein n=1 Tax=Neokomagataea tanensis NBRC 106556 TaxID=1223519 RepID=A0ABQ0QGF5_9PROT|nr:MULTISPECIES: oligopeptide/dipeptide ABC transporter ATP-binding protein [Neokomagataea]GBR43916.1 peptide ABC transporter ATP-binding protein [Neokomagataea tanensis NBRC 106556]
MQGKASSAPLLEVTNLHRRYPVGKGRVLHAVSGVSFTVRRGEALALVGESGCGKSTLGRLLIALDRPDEGEVRFDGQVISGRSDRSLRAVRPRMQMVFQDSLSSFNPRRRVGDALLEPLKIHGRSYDSSTLERLLVQVGLPPDIVGRFPKTFSGGQRQRLNIARALVLQPELLVADEPVSALDVSLQAQIINVFHDLRAELGLSCVFISHDLSVVRQMADRVAVMYLGRIVELGETLSLMKHPAHPYTRALLESIPRLHHPLPDALQGDVPSPVDVPQGCPFHTRCPSVQSRCAHERPVLRPVEGGRDVACHYPV